jgi:RNA-dependent RNA polymerase
MNRKKGRYHQRARFQEQSIRKNYQFRQRTTEQIELEEAELNSVKRASPVFVANVPFICLPNELIAFFNQQLSLIKKRTSYSYVIKCVMMRGDTGKFNGRAVVFLQEPEHAYLLKTYPGNLTFKGRNLLIKDYTGNLSCKSTAENSVFKGNRLEIGSGISNLGFVPQFSIESSVKVEFTSLDIRGLEIRYWSDRMMYKIMISYRRMAPFEICRSKGINDELIVTWRVQIPPMLFRRPSNDPDSPDSDNEESSASDEIWWRIMDPTKYNVFGRCRWYRLAFPIKQAPAILDYLKSRQVFGIDRGLTLQHTLNITRLEPLVSFPLIEDAQATFQSWLTNLPFSISYLLCCLQSAGKLDFIGFIISDLTEILSFHGLITQLSLKKAEYLLSYLLNDLSNEIISTPYADLQQLMTGLELGNDENGEDVFIGQQLSSDNQSNQEMIYTRRVYITPLRIVAKAPELDQFNRILRQFIHWKHRFIRVTFVDEHLGPAYRLSNELYDLRIGDILRNGFSCGGRFFTFLAYSNSQLREHSAWFYDSHPTHPVDDPNIMNPPPSIQFIRQQVGDLSHITTVGKFGARLGQGFSSSMATIHLPKSQSQLEDDIEIEFNSSQFAFSDGVGRMSLRLAKKIQEEMKLEVCPSAVQIRWGGCKGVISLNPNDNETTELVVRKSMHKFPSTHEGLEILSIAHTLPMYLNRQLIPLLTYLGIPDEVILRALRRILQYIDRALINTEHALQLLRFNASYGISVTYQPVHSEEESVLSLNDILRRDGLLHVSHVIGLCYRALLSGFDIQSEPFLNELMKSLCLRILQQIQYKARIFIPQAVCLMGIMDEYHVLEAEEVFVQFKDLQTSEYRILENIDVAVGRNPSLHPGDIRIVRAVNKPSLSHLREVIVFPQRGARPLVSMMSGGDLDGDLYFVLYDPEFVPSRDRQVTPLNYSDIGDKFSINRFKELINNLLGNNNMFTAGLFSSASARATETETETPSLETKLADYYVNYMKNDNLGQIAISHMIFADQEKDTVMNSKCVHLAELHSMAVDFPKTGKPAIYPQYRYLFCPDFMERARNPVYPSEKPLGRIYRTVKDYNRSHLLAHGMPRVVIDQKLLVTGWETFEEDAKYLYWEYAAKLQQLMHQFHDIPNEIELLNGFVPFQIKQSEKTQEVQVRMYRAVTLLRKEFLKIFWTEFVDELATYFDVDDNGASRVNDELAILEQFPFSQLPSIIVEKAMQKASAWYYVAYKTSASERLHDKCLSFGWIAARCLCEIKRRFAKV